MTDLARHRDNRVGSERQIASARLLEFADGPERGQRAVFLSSGGGLDLFVTVDRSFDIGELRWRGRQIAWLGPHGLPSLGLIDREGDGGMGFGRGFGGFLVTCGLTHFGPATKTEPQHGRFPYLPARLLSHGEEFGGSVPCVFAEGEVVQARHGAEALRLRRRIELPVGGNSLCIRDTIRNVGSAPTPLRVMYHFNLGYPLVRTGAVAALDGRPVAGPVTLPDPGADLTAESHACAGPEAAVCTFGAGVEQIRFSWPRAALPYLQLWKNLSPGNGVFSVEPRTALPAEPGPVLKPDEEMDLTLTAEFPANGING